MPAVSALQGASHPETRRRGQGPAVDRGALPTEAPVSSCAAAGQEEEPLFAGGLWVRRWADGAVLADLEFVSEVAARARGRWAERRGLRAIFRNSPCAKREVALKSRFRSWVYSGTDCKI